ALEHLRLQHRRAPNKRPSVFINYLRALANAKGMTFDTQRPPAPAEVETATEDQAAAPEEDKSGVQGKQHRGRQGPCPRGVRRDLPAQVDG
ncbi:MAG: hypothetical protein ACKPKO_00575, partial [Candidatus Fonsibacter sp.]